MSIEHAFKPAPFYPNRCDVRVDDGGGRRQCAARPSEHVSANPRRAVTFEASGEFAAWPQYFAPGNSDLLELCRACGVRLGLHHSIGKRCPTPAEVVGFCEAERYAARAEIELYDKFGKELRAETDKATEARNAALKSRVRWREYAARLRADAERLVADRNAWQDLAVKAEKERDAAEKLVARHEEANKRAGEILLRAMMPCTRSKGPVSFTAVASAVGLLASARLSTHPLPEQTQAEADATPKDCTREPHDGPCNGMPCAYAKSRPCPATHVFGEDLGRLGSGTQCSLKNDGHKRHIAADGRWWEVW
jgi:hypothetical protein